MKQRGFTIIEVVIAIAIAAFLLAAVMPSAGAWIRNSRLRTAAESISVGMQQARNEAVRRNQPVGFFLVSDADAMSMTDGCALSSSVGLGGGARLARRQVRHRPRHLRCRAGRRATPLSG